MKAKIIPALAILTVTLFATLAVLDIASEESRCKNLLLVSPLSATSSGFNTDSVEQFCEDEFLVTYEIRQEKNAVTANSGKSVALVGTNACYTDILGYSMLDGSFLTKAAWKAKSRQAALNEKAAFELFGSMNITGMSFKIGGESWIVTGVIRDGDKDSSNVYVPSSVIGGQPASLMALMGGGIGETYAKNALKSLGARDSSHEFFNLSKLSSHFGERFAIAWKIALMAVCILIIKFASADFIVRFTRLKDGLRDKYLLELVSAEKPEALKAAGGALLSLAAVSGALALSLQVLEAFLVWRDLAPVNKDITEFASKLSWLQTYHTPGVICFAAFLCAAALLFILVLARPVRKREKRAGLDDFEEYGDYSYNLE